MLQGRSASAAICPRSVLIKIKDRFSWKSLGLAVASLSVISAMSIDFEWKNDELIVNI
jgi:hypothetical protein